MITITTTNISIIIVIIIQLLYNSNNVIIAIKQHASKQLPIALMTHAVPLLVSYFEKLITLSSLRTLFYACSID